jgi:hypothetical protein
VNVRAAESRAPALARLADLFRNYRDAALYRHHAEGHPAAWHSCAEASCEEARGHLMWLENADVPVEDRKARAAPRVDNRRDSAAAIGWKR